MSVDITMKLYTCLGSGNCYKIELMLRLCDQDYEEVTINIPEGEHRDPEFLKLTPFGQIPVLVDNAQVFTDSQAILCYLARAYGGDKADQWLPTDAAGLSHVMRWLSVSANEIYHGPTIARASRLLKWPIDYDLAIERSYRLLNLMNGHLKQRDWLAADHATVADIACYPYLFLAAEGGVDTESYDAVTAWMRRFEAMPGFWPIPRIPGLPQAPLVPAPV
jgi:glutathione S-transferase